MTTPSSFPDNPSAEINAWLDGVDNLKSAPDQLGRTTFVASLCRALVQLPRDRSVVTGVFGPWGSGKTWLLERIVEQLESTHASQISVCRFSPWEVNSKEQMLAEFFATVRELIPEKNTKRNPAKLWEQLTTSAVIGSLGFSGAVAALQVAGNSNAIIPEVAAASIPKLLEFLKGVFQIASKATKDRQRQLSLSETKSELSQALIDELDQPILIIIDDLDRLTDEEIQLMIRLLNTTANLPKLHYLIFGDRQQIASALNPICGDQGDRYLEKLIQNTFQVPEPGENQVRLRLWEGLEKIAEEIQLDLAPHNKRFSEFWDDFLKLRLRNLRDCHRLLRTFSFHVRSLTREGSLEVDPMDLLGIDFLRVFDPTIYQWIASGNFSKPWWHHQIRKSKDEDPDDALVIKSIESSRLEIPVICGALTRLFPFFAGSIAHLLERYQLTHLRYATSNHVPDLAVREIEFFPIYFKLDLSANDLPQAKLTQFLLTTANHLPTIDLMREFSSHGWLTQLFGRLRSRPELIPAENFSHLLLALSCLSDDLQYTPGLEEHELRGAFYLTDTIIQHLSRENKESAVIEAIVNSSSVSLALYLIGELRGAAGCRLAPEGNTIREMPKLASTEIERLCDTILPEVEKKFWMTLFMKQDYEPLRAYWMAHALGPERTELVLKKASEGPSSDRIWHLINGIAFSIMQEISIDSWQHDLETSVAGTSLLNRLKRFASSAYWSSFLAQDSERPRSKFEAAWLPHLLAAIQKEQNQDPPARDEDTP